MSDPTASCARRRRSELSVAEGDTIRSRRLMTTFLLDAVRNLASPVLGPRRPRVALRHRATGALFGHDDYVVFADDNDAVRFLSQHACEPEAWETVPLAS
jgi:hypothetical protein